MAGLFDKAHIVTPPGTPVPASGLCNTTVILMAALPAIAFLSNALMRPVHPNHHLPAKE